MATQIGPHSVEVSGDIITVRLRGPFTLPHMVEWCRLADQIISQHGSIYTISDFAGGGDFPADSRRHANNWPNNLKVRASILIGSSALQRVVVTMLVRAVQARKKDAPILVSLKTESEALAFIAEHRAKAQRG